MTARCRSCNAQIVWLSTATGKKIPVDLAESAQAYERDEAIFDPHDPDLVSHFATCPDAATYRKGRA